MKVLTAAQMREIDRRTIELGIPGIVLMENAAHRVVEFLAARFAPLSRQRIVILCGKGNNGGDGLAVARQLHTRFSPRSLDVLLAAEPGELRGDAAENLRMLHAAGCGTVLELTSAMERATLVVDALLGTGLNGPATGRAAELIHAINTRFPDAGVVAVDVPSGMASDRAENDGPCARADATVTFTAPKICHVLAPNCDRTGELVIGQIGTPRAMIEEDPALSLSLIEPGWFARLFAPRPRGWHKGNFGHVLVVAGSAGKSGAAAMTGLAALRAGAGLVTVASTPPALPLIAAHAPELMTEPLAETESGGIAGDAYARFEQLLDRKNVVAAGPGIGLDPGTVSFLRRMYGELPLPAVIDADGLNALAGSEPRSSALRLLTPHPGELARLCGCSIHEVQANRLEIARRYSVERGVTLVLKGQRTILAFPDGRLWVNPTGTPAMATAGSGDILTGLISGLLAQHPADAELALAAAVWLHGRAGELGASELGEQCLIATDLLRFLPEAIRELRNLHDAQ
jgi:NAD(P)H-hydrate epimerase